MSSASKNLVIVRSVVDQGLTTAQAAAKFGVSRQWVHQLVQRYRTGGAAAVLPQSKAPKTRPQNTTDAVRARIIALRQTLVTDGADAGPETISWHLDREGLHVPASSTIQRILRAAGLVTPQPKKRPQVLVYTLPSRTAKRVLASRYHLLVSDEWHPSRDLGLLG